LYSKCTDCRINIGYQESLFVGWKVYSYSTNKAKMYSYSIFVQQMYWLQDEDVSVFMFDLRMINMSSECEYDWYWKISACSTEYEICDSFASLTRHQTLNSGLQADIFGINQFPFKQLFCATCRFHHSYLTYVQFASGIISYFLFHEIKL
jgi:hypothetical protein